MVVFLLLGAHVVLHETIETTRLFRVEQTYAVKMGKWYFEFEAITGGDMRVGWARPGCRPDVELGADDQVFVFDGYRVSELLLCSTQELLVSLAVNIFSLPQGRRMHIGSRYFGQPWKKGDIVGCMINMEDKSMIFTLNGELLITNKGSELCFTDFETEDGGEFPDSAQPPLID